MARWQGARFRPTARYFALAACAVSGSLAGPTPAWAQTAAPPPEEVSRGLRLLKMQGCVACHSLDGSASAGPSLAGRWGTDIQVRDPSGAELRTVPFDQHYLVRSLEHPDLELASGFAPGVMPTFALTAEQTDAVAAALQSLDRPSEQSRPAIAEGVLLALVALGVALLVLKQRGGSPNKNSGQ